MPGHGVELNAARVGALQEVRDLVRRGLAKGPGGGRCDLPVVVGEYGEQRMQLIRRLEREEPFCGEAAELGGRFPVAQDRQQVL
ncbi:MAG: hypothetical protein ABR576_15400 [Thermoanaerobaculia bacterium]